jgi:hypothetical protein
MLKRGSQIIPREVIAALVDDLDLLGLMVVLACEANHHDSVAPGGTPLKPGQLVTGKRALAARFKRTESWCYRGLKRLQERTLIELEGNRDGTVVTVCNWQTYTRLPKRREPPPKRKRTANEPSSDRQRTASEPPSRHKALGISPSPPTPQGERGGWEELIEELEALGVTQASRAAAAAQASGCEPEDFLPHLDHWKAKRELWASPQGVLYRRLEYLRPDQRALEGWPPFDSAKEAKKRDDESLRRVRDLINNATDTDEWRELREIATGRITNENHSENAIQWQMEQVVVSRHWEWAPRLRDATAAARSSTSNAISTAANPVGATVAAEDARPPSAVGMLDLQGMRV